MTLALDELERKAKAALWPDDTEPKTHEHYCALLDMQEAATPAAVLALIDRVRTLEKREHEWRASTGIMQPETEDT